MTKLEREHVEKALDEIGDPSTVPHEKRAWKFCLVAREKHWSPNYVVGVAWKYVTAEETPHSQFPGGIEDANQELERLGYTIVPCAAAMYH